MARSQRGPWGGSGLSPLDLGGAVLALGQGEVSEGRFSREGGGARGSLWHKMTSSRKLAVFPWVSFIVGDDHTRGHCETDGRGQRGFSTRVLNTPGKDRVGPIPLALWSASWFPLSGRFHRPGPRSIRRDGQEASVGLSGSASPAAQQHVLGLWPCSLQDGSAGSISQLRVQHPRQGPRERQQTDFRNQPCILRTGFDSHVIRF